MMHDFGATSTHTVIIDVPLSLDMVNLVRGKPILHYDPTQACRFGVLPRYAPEQCAGSRARGVLRVPHGEQLERPR